MSKRNVEVLAMTMFKAWVEHKGYRQRWDELSNRQREMWLTAAYVADESSVVDQFQTKFGHCNMQVADGSREPEHEPALSMRPPRRLTERKLLERARFIREELEELEEAIKSGDYAGVADALVDLVYVAKGTANMLALPWAELFYDVHRANMAKVPGVGKRGNLVDVIKPEGWRGPDTAGILERAGFDPKSKEYDDPQHVQSTITNKEG